MSAEVVSQIDFERAQFVKGLRDLANFIAGDDSVPVPKVAFLLKTFRTWAEDDAVDGFLAAARALDRPAVEKLDEVKVVREFTGGIEFEIRIAAADVCERHQVTQTSAAWVLPPELEEGC